MELTVCSASARTLETPHQQWQITSLRRLTSIQATSLGSHSSTISVQIRALPTRLSLVMLTTLMLEISSFLTLSTATLTTELSEISSGLYKSPMPTGATSHHKASPMTPLSWPLLTNLSTLNTISTRKLRTTSPEMVVFAALTWQLALSTADFQEAATTMSTSYRLLISTLLVLMATLSSLRFPLNTGSKLSMMVLVASV